MCVGGIIVCVGIPLVWPVPLVGLRDLAVLATMGVVQLAVPVVLLVRGARHVPATQMALIALLDVPLNPLWAWIGVGEAPTAEAAIGGGIIVAAVTAVVAGWRRPRPALETPSVAERLLGAQIGFAGGASRRRRW